MALFQKVCLQNLNIIPKERVTGKERSENPTHQAQNPTPLQNLPSNLRKSAGSPFKPTNQQSNPPVQKTC
jgi:hypothetical protein